MCSPRFLYTKFNAQRFLFEAFFDIKRIFGCVERFQYIVILPMFTLLCSEVSTHGGAQIRELQCMPR